MRYAKIRPVRTDYCDPARKEMEIRRQELGGVAKRSQRERGKVVIEIYSISLPLTVSMHQSGKSQE